MRIRGKKGGDRREESGGPASTRKAEAAREANPEVNRHRVPGLTPQSAAPAGSLCEVSPAQKGWVRVGVDRKFERGTRGAEGLASNTGSGIVGLQLAFSCKTAVL